MKSPNPGLPPRPGPNGSVVADPDPDTPGLLISRRQAISQALALAGGSAIAGRHFQARGADLPSTPENVQSPFYPLGKPIDRHADPNRIRGRKNRAAGNGIEVSGRVPNFRGESLRGVRQEIWQANTHGRHDHCYDDSGLREDPNFQGYAAQKTDREGRFAFRSVTPGAFPAEPGWTRPPQVHFPVESRVSRLVTQMSFPEETLNEKAQLFLSLGQYAPAAVACVAPPDTNSEPGAIRLSRDIVRYARSGLRDLQK